MEQSRLTYMTEGANAAIDEVFCPATNSFENTVAKTVASTVIDAWINNHQTV